ncbi:4-alpha-glucanotransferase [Parasalinivibrio latis]
MDTQGLKAVASRAGLSDTYISAWGEPTNVSDTVLVKLLSALGYDTKNDAALLASAERKQRVDILSPVLVIREEQPVDVALSLGKTVRIGDFSWSLTLENGECLEGWLESQVVSDTREDDGKLVFRLADSLPLGYHQLTLRRKRRKSPFISTLIVAPASCYKQESLQADKKLWGTTVQLYTLKTEQNWGIGDFGDLMQLVGGIANRGGDFVGLNPIHSLFPANPEGASPYSPSSRRWLNVLYIDVSSVPEFALSDEAQQLVGSADFQTRIKDTRDSEWVKYSDVAALKMSVLPMLWETFKSRQLEKKTDRAQTFNRFVDAGGESLLHQAAFDALHAELKKTDDSLWGWPVFPEEYRHFSNPAVQSFIKQHQDKVHFYMYLQWLAEEQLAAVQQLAEERGMDIGLYRDLAVGVCDSGAESWADEGALCLDASIGAPPDILGPLGQNWGLPPLNPEYLVKHAYRPFIELLRANMKHCGALRIDHVLGLLRLWWIPRGDSARDGAYLYYPVSDLLAILALESHRNQCSIIGEDLGTVPDEIVEPLADGGVHSYKVFFFETAKDGGYLSPLHYPDQSMATLCTHDMPTLRGFWHCDDLRLGEELGLYPDKEQLEGLFQTRAEMKQKMLDSIRWHGWLPDYVGQDALYVPMDKGLSHGMQLHLAAGSSSLLGLQLEDWLEMDKPVNVPGTVDEYPNWRRKLSTTLDDLFSRQEINQLCQRLTDVRAKAGKHEG